MKEGPANQSYGLQVAKLAGVPPAVIRRARAYLAELEQQSVRHAAAASPQRELAFAGPATDDADTALHDALEELDPDDMTPKQALEALYRLKQLR